MARLRVHLPRPALRRLPDRLRAVAGGPAHAGSSVLGTPRRVLLGTAVAGATAVVAAGALALGGSGAATPAGAHHPVAASGSSAAAATAPGTAGAALAGGVLGGDPAGPGTSLIGFGGGAAAAAAPRAPVADQTPPSALAAGGIPLTALTAYKRAGAAEATKQPSCHLPWPLLAGIGRVESDHGRFAGAVLHASGVSTPRIIGIPLDGNGTALIRDTDHGRLDGDTVYDRAVGPMQFIPSTWTGWGRDGNGDGVRDPFNIFDAAAAAADYLCAAGRDLATYRGQVAAVLSYNHSAAYVSEVLGLEKIYGSGAVGVTIPVLPTTPDPKVVKSVGRPTLPPVDPGPPRALVPPAKPKPKPTPTPKPSATSSTPGGAPTGSSSAPGGAGSSSSAPTEPPPPSSSTPPPPSTSTDPTGTPPPDSSTPSTDPPVGDPSTDEPPSGAGSGGPDTP